MEYKRPDDFEEVVNGLRRKRINRAADLLVLAWASIDCLLATNEALRRALACSAPNVPGQSGQAEPLPTAANP